MKNISSHCKLFLKNNLSWLILAVILILTAYVRYRLIDVPLQRDEGGYAYIGRLNLHGFPPYSFAYDVKFPGIFLAYSLIFALFGHSPQGIHLGLLFVNSFTIVAIFFLGKHITNKLGALVAASSFAILSIGMFLSGMTTQPEHFVLLFVVCGSLALLIGVRDKSIKWIFFSGVLFGLGLLMKQNAVAFVIFAGIYILYDLIKNLRSISLSTFLKLFLAFIAGLALVIIPVILIFAYIGILPEFYFWTIFYPSIYVSHVPINLAWGKFSQKAICIFNAAPLLWWVISVGMLFAVYFFIFKLGNQLKSLCRSKKPKQLQETRSRINLGKNKKKPTSRKKIKHFDFFLLMFAVFSFLSICPGFYFRPHYFLLLIPCASLLAGVAVYYLSDILLFFSDRPLFRYGIPIFLFLICFVQSVYLQRDYLFHMTPNQVCRLKYGLNPFIESIEIAKFIKKHTTPEDTIAILGSEPQIFFYADRFSASPYILMYPLTLRSSKKLTVMMQIDFIRGIEKKAPKYLVFVNVRSSWGMSMLRKNNNIIFGWFNEYTQKNYTLVGMVNIFKEKTLYRWDVKDMKLSPDKMLWVAIFKRN